MSFFGATNGFFETAIIFGLAWLLMLFGNSISLGGVALYGLAGVVLLCLACYFHHFRFRLGDYINLEGLIGSSYIVRDAAEMHESAESPPTMPEVIIWWAFRIAYALGGLLMLAIAAEGYLIRTDTIRTTLLQLTQ